MINEIQQTLQDAVTVAKDGLTSPMQVYAELSTLEKICKELKDEIKPDAMNEFQKYGQKTVKHGMFEISKTAGGRYTYPDDFVTYQRSVKEVKNLEKLMQQVYNGIKSGTNAVIVHEETGEVIPAATYVASEESLAIKISK